MQNSENIGKINSKSLNSEEKWNLLLNIMSKLRADDGCPWDREQTHESLKSSLIEESYEVLDAIESGSAEKLADELGDLLLQVVFHAQIAKEANRFQIDDVLDNINNKMIRRHPHVFANQEAETAQDVLNQWEIIKANEKNGGAKKGLMDVNDNLPALMLAQKVQLKAARLGFDWENINGAWQKLDEEISEFKAAETREDQHEELGDCFFSLINVARFMGLDSEDALRHTVKKFLSRFKHVENRMEEQGKKWNETSLEEMDNFWEEAKHQEKQGK